MSLLGESLCVYVCGCGVSFFVSLSVCLSVVSLSLVYNIMCMCCVSDVKLQLQDDSGSAVGNEFNIKADIAVLAANVATPVQLKVGATLGSGAEEYEIGTIDIVMAFEAGACVCACVCVCMRCLW